MLSRYQIDIFLSTDKKLADRALRNKSKLFVAIKNPLRWFDEKELPILIGIYDVNLEGCPITE